MPIEDTSIDGFGTNEAFRGQSWGAYPIDPVPAAPPAFAPYAWAVVNSDGTLAESSGNLTASKGSAGVYTFFPTDGSVLPATKIFVAPMPDVPLSANYSYGTGPGSAGFSIEWQNPTTGTFVPTDVGFRFTLFLAA